VVEEVGHIPEDRRKEPVASAHGAIQGLTEDPHMLSTSHDTICAWVVTTCCLLLLRLGPLLARSLVLGWCGPLALILGDGRLIS
jgi:hypothetical protein